MSVEIRVPVGLVDALLPGLRDTELRVLLALLRQLRVAGRERETVWLTHRELCRRTGRAGEAVSAAVDSLSRTGLIGVRDETGRILASAADRQHGTGRRYFRLTGPLSARTAGEPPPHKEARRANSDAEKPKTIDSYNNSIYRFRNPDLVPSPGVVLPARQEEESGHLAASASEARVVEAKRRIRETLASIHAPSPGPRPPSAPPPSSSRR